MPKDDDLAIPSLPTVATIYLPRTPCSGSRKPRPSAEQELRAHKRAGVLADIAAVAAGVLAFCIAAAAFAIWTPL